MTCRDSGWDVHVCHISLQLCQQTHTLPFPTLSGRHVVAAMAPKVKQVQKQRNVSTADAEDVTWEGGDVAAEYNMDDNPMAIDAPMAVDAENVRNVGTTEPEVEMAPDVKRDGTASGSGEGGDAAGGAERKADAVGRMEADEDAT